MCRKVTWYLYYFICNIALFSTFSISFYFCSGTFHDGQNMWSVEPSTNSVCPTVAYPVPCLAVHSWARICQMLQYHVVKQRSLSNQIGAWVLPSPFPVPCSDYLSVLIKEFILCATGATITLMHIAADGDPHDRFTSRGRFKKSKINEINYNTLTHPSPLPSFPISILFCKLNSSTNFSSNLTGAHAMHCWHTVNLENLTNV